ncbi:MAG: thioredoxin family protein [Cytophagales bacterium]|nr:thioredoxin family protein [Cytophagales bacterium]
MKSIHNILLFCLFLFIISSSNAQVQKPATWTYKASETQIVPGQVIELIFTAIIDNGWYMYSVGKFESAPAATFKINAGKGYKIIDTTYANHDKYKKDEYIGEYRYFVGKAEFRQKIKILSPDAVITGTYEYSTCSLESGICLPPKEEDFSIGGFVLKKKLLADSLALPKADTNTALPSVSDTIMANTDTTISAEDQNTKPVTISPANTSDTNLWSFFVLAFLSGIIALLTPCVFPMIPMTVTFFLNSGQSRAQSIFKAAIYGGCIILIYTIIGTLVAKLVGPEAANFLSTHWLPNLFFFFIFVLFALSFLGMFEIVLPSWLINASDKNAEKGGYLGIFFMAFTLVLVSFSCTGPIVGTILVQSAGGATLLPIVGMFGFSLAFAIPFTLFAIFPQWLQNLPKSGGWLNTVKVILGFLELALSLKFLSLADQAYHWGILDRDVNIAIWCGIFSALAAYLLDFYRLPHDSPIESVSVPRAILAMICLSFVIYIAPGMWGAPLKPLSGYLPPLSSQDFVYDNNSNLPASNVAYTTCDMPKYGDFLHLPHHIQGYFDYKQAQKCALEQKKPVFIDFTGHGCVNCREMEANVWSHPEVLKRLKEKFVVVALYVDDKTELPESEWYTSTFDQKIKKSIGKQNADFQITKYNNNAQPYYIIEDAEGNMLLPPKAYDLDPQNFIAFLDEALLNFSNK